MLRSVLILVMVMMAAPAAAAEWRPNLNDSGDQVRWASCTVEYSVGGPQYTASRNRALRDAIRSVEKASGLDFNRVPKARAELRISMTGAKSKTLLGAARWITTGHRVIRAEIDLYRLTYRQSRAEQTNLHRHELGHVLGLAHIRGNDVMNPKITAKRTRTGWSSGLRSLYRRCR